MIKFKERISKIFKGKLNLQELSKKHSFKELKDYAEKYLGKEIGRGNGRIVYSDGDKILKIATSEFGIQQNKVEYKTIILMSKFKDHIDNSFFLKVYDSDISGKWILMEKVDEVISTDPKEIRRGFSPKIIKDQTGYNSLKDLCQSVMENKIKKKNPFTKALIYLKDNLGMKDFDLLQFGVVTRGGKKQLVFLDLGLNNYTWDRFYQGI